MKTNSKRSAKIQYILGMPMRWEINKAFHDVWNPKDSQIFPPKHFGIGWGLNFHALFRELGLIKKRK